MVPLQCRHGPSLASCRECCFYNYVLFELLWQNKISSSSSSSTLKTLYSVSLYIFYVVNILFLVLLFYIFLYSCVQLCSVDSASSFSQVLFCLPISTPNSITSICCKTCTTNLCCGFVDICGFPIVVHVCGTIYLRTLPPLNLSTYIKQQLKCTYLVSSSYPGLTF